MLATPRFDTYRILEAYAKNPNSRRTEAGFALLKRATARQLQWEVFMRMMPGMDVGALFKMHIGALEKHQTDSLSERLFDPTKAAALSQDERDDIYMKLCGKAGLHISKDMIEHARTREKAGGADKAMRHTEADGKHD